MSTIRSIDMLLVDDLFEMSGGYVLNFSDRTFAQFFASELNVDIDDAAYRRDGTSKAKRLRCFLQITDNALAVRTLQALWEYREAVRVRSGTTAEALPNAYARFQELVGRLGSTRPGATTVTPLQGRGPSDERIRKLSGDLIELSQLAPQPRGYAFEGFLKELFDAHGMEGREPFRQRGEQIDGSFLLNGDTYLLEARWQNAQTGAGDLHAFHGKVEEKAAWARGLFIAQSGFTDDGLHAFGRGKRVICKDGLDLYETLNRRLPLNEVLARKVRRAAETGSPFIRVRDLFLV
jgi:hypothetical protein